MPSTNRTAILARTGQVVAAAALMGGVAFGANHTVGNRLNYRPIRPSRVPSWKRPSEDMDQQGSFPPVCVPPNRRARVEGGIVDSQQQNKT
jgi:hypothetical protein